MFVPGPLAGAAQVRQIDYVGDGTDDRVIELGGRYDVAELTFLGHAGSNALKWARAIRDWYAYWTTNAAGARLFRIGSQANGIWQGFNSDRTAVTLGSGGSVQEGSNFLGQNYRLIVTRFNPILV